MAIKNRTVSLCLTLSKKEILIQIEDLNTLVQLGSQVHGKEKMSARDAINWPLKALKPPKKASKETAVSSNPKHYPPSSPSRLQLARQDSAAARKLVQRGTSECTRPWW